MNDPVPIFGDRKKPMIIEERFAQWWGLWSIPGTKRGRGHARKAFMRIMRKKEATFEELCEGVTAYMEWNILNDNAPRHIKHPATWLNAESWADDLSVDQDNPFSHFTD